MEALFLGWRGPWVGPTAYAPEFESQYPRAPGPCWDRAVGPFNTHGAGPFGAWGLLGGLSLGSRSRPFWDSRQGPISSPRCGPHGLRGVLNRNYKAATTQRIVEGGRRSDTGQPDVDTRNGVHRWVPNKTRTLFSIWELAGPAAGTRRAASTDPQRANGSEFVKTHKIFAI